MTSIEEIANMYGVSITDARKIARVLDSEEFNGRSAEIIDLERVWKIWNTWQENSRRDLEKQALRLWAPVIEHGKKVGLRESEAIKWFKEEQTNFLRTGLKPSDNFIRLSMRQVGVVEDVGPSWRRMKYQWQKRKKRGGDRKYVVRRSAGLTLTSKLRKQVIDEEGDRCSYCHEFTDAPEVDHIVQTLGRYLNGSRNNLTVACPSCNKSKGGGDVLAWARTQGPSILWSVVELLKVRQLFVDECIYCGEVLTDNTLGMCDGCWSDVTAS